MNGFVIGEGLAGSVTRVWEKQERGRFLVGEALRTNKDGFAVHACFRQQSNSEFFAKNMTVQEFKEMKL